MSVNLEFGVHSCQIWLLNEVCSYLELLVKDRRQLCVCKKCKKIKMCFVMN